jgi:hypothetical protein
LISNGNGVSGERLLSVHHDVNGQGAGWGTCTNQNSMRRPQRDKLQSPQQQIPNLLRLLRAVSAENNWEISFSRTHSWFGGSSRGSSGGSAPLPSGKISPSRFTLPMYTSTKGTSGLKKQERHGCKRKATETTLWDTPVLRDVTREGRRTVRPPHGHPQVLHDTGKPTFRVHAPMPR